MRARLIRPLLLSQVFCLFGLVGYAGTPRTADAVEKGRTFLAGLFNAGTGLLPEYRGAKVYWLFHDNYLAAKVLARSHPEIARSIRASMEREGVRNSGKIEILFGEAERPLPFRGYELVDVRSANGKLLRTEIATTNELRGWTEYADLLLLACLAETNRPTAKQHWDAAMRLWDGKGFMDAAAKHQQRYATYKLGLALLAARQLSPQLQVPDALLDRLLSMQEASGGWVTDYDAAGKRIGVANVETTCISILGLGSQESSPRN